MKRKQCGGWGALAEAVLVRDAIPLIAIANPGACFLPAVLVRSNQRAGKAEGHEVYKDGAAQLERIFPPPKASSVAESQAGLLTGVFVWRPCRIRVHLKITPTTGEAGFSPPASSSTPFS